MAPVMSKQRTRHAAQKDNQVDALLIATQRVRPALDALLAVLQESAKGCRVAAAEVGAFLEGALQSCTEVLTSCCCSGALHRLFNPPWIRADGAPLFGNLPVMFVLQIVVMLYNAFVFAYMPAAGLALNSPTSLVFHALIFMLLSSFVSAVNTDPGRVPAEDKWRCHGFPPPELTESKRVVSAQPKWQARWCHKTESYKPDRAHHCSSLGRVVLRMDHYCPWIRNTVGFGNHKFFFLFLFYANAACGMLNVSLLDLLTHATLPALTKFLLIGSTGLSTLLSTLLGPFFLFHCWLLGNNMTTIEFIEKRGNRDDCGGATLPRRSTYDIGVYRNICSVLGDNPLLWMVPVGGPSGNGLSFPRRLDVVCGPQRPLLDVESKTGIEDTILQASRNKIADREDDAENPKGCISDELEEAETKASTADEVSSSADLELGSAVHEDLHMHSGTSSGSGSSQRLWTRAASELSELTDDFKVGCEFLSYATQDGCQNLREVARASIVEAAGTLNDAMYRFTSICAGTNKRSSKAYVGQQSRAGQSQA